jgi:tetratricopeptide (TPR) repeat protein
VLILFLAACSTKKNKFPNRAYHNVTARYNAYFYAKESVKEGVTKLVKSHKDDYTQILPITILPNDENVKDLYPEMDRAFEKSSKVINRHSMNIKNKEYCKWIKDNYLLIGISHFYKKDYFAAIEVFEYVAKQYKKEDIKIDALIWLLRSYNYAVMWDQVEKVYDLLENEQKFPQNKRKFYAIALAEYHLNQRDYEKTERELVKAIKLTENTKFSFKEYAKTSGRRYPLYKKKAYLARKKFVLAQIYQEMNDDVRANRYFDEVIKLNPSYEMVFHAKILQAKSFNVSPKKRKEIKEMLTKMLKDSKNFEYRDQIFYALGEIEEFDNNIENAQSLFRKAVDAYISNDRQKGMSYLKLADIHFEKENYKYAQVFYDSAFPLLPETHPNYKLIESKKNSLNDLVYNLDIIEREDSLQMVANMDEKTRDKHIEKLIKEYEDELEKQAELLRQAELQAANDQLLQGQTAGSPAMPGFNTGEWYFYNQATKGLGMAEFAKKWGKRALEDNWRRSNKTSTGGGFGDEENEENELTSEEESQEEKIDPRTTKEFYLKDLPLSDSLMEASSNKIIEAYYTAANIFKEELKDNKRGIEYYEALINRYPENLYKLPSYYQLYRSHTILGNTPKAEYYKNILINQYPDSKYTMIILDPDYDVDRRPDLEKAENYYEITYQNYKSEDYFAVLDRCQVAEAKYFDTDYAPRFAMLKALTKGKIYGRSFLIKELEIIIKDFPGHEIKEPAEEMLLTIKGIEGEDGNKIIEDAEFIYTLDKSDKHKCMIIFSSAMNTNDAKVALSEFNGQYFRNENLSVSNLFLDSENQIIIVNGIKNFLDAVRYHKAIKNDQSIKSKTADTKNVFVIGDENFKVFFKDKGIPQYQEFFEKYYLNLN